MIWNIRFTTADKVAGGKGFRAVWTEVKIPALVGGYDCDDGGLYFRCANSTFCIAKHLECDGNPNCGLHDNSDEGAHCMSISYRLISVSYSVYIYISTYDCILYFS